MSDTVIALRPLHSSIPSHLSTELQVLGAITERSKYQHRSQPFLRRMREVLRLGSRVGDILGNEDDTKAVEVSENAKVEIVLRFVQCLLKATVAIQQIIELEHFLPTQISVIAVYGRLFTLGISIANHLGLDVAQVLRGNVESGSKSKGKKRKRKGGDVGEPFLDEPMIYEDPNLDLGLQRVVSRRVDMFDMGQRIERPVTVPAIQPELPIPNHSRSPTRSPRLSPIDPQESISSGSPPPSSPDIDILPSKVRSPTPEPKPKLKKKKILASSVDVDKAGTSTKKTKIKGKKKKDDMDDIFGF